MTEFTVDDDFLHAFNCWSSPKYVLYFDTIVLDFSLMVVLKYGLFYHLHKECFQAIVGSQSLFSRTLSEAVSKLEKHINI